jgi:hypothetical protein
MSIRTVYFFTGANVLETITSGTIHQLSIAEINITSLPINTKYNPDFVRASGYFANNQIQDGIITWIQGGFWSLAMTS